MASVRQGQRFLLVGNRLCIDFANSSAPLGKADEDAGNKRALSLWNDSHPPFNERVANLDALMPKYKQDGQALADRYAANINTAAFGSGGGAMASAPAYMPAGSSAAPRTVASGPEYDGVVSKVVILLTNGRLAEGTRVKVRPQP